MYLYYKLCFYIISYKQIIIYIYVLYYYLIYFIIYFIHFII